MGRLKGGGERLVDLNHSIRKRPANASSAFKQLCARIYLSPARGTAIFILFYNMHAAFLPLSSFIKISPIKLIRTSEEGKEWREYEANENWKGPLKIVGKKKWINLCDLSIINLGMNLSEFYLSPFSSSISNFLACRRSLSIRSFFINYNCKQRRRSAFEYVKSVVLRIYFFLS